MKKRKRSRSILVTFGIGAAIGGITALLADIMPLAPLEREWITYALLVVLLLMTFRISVLWIRSTKPDDLTMDVDELTLYREKLAHNFIGSTSLYLIVGFGSLFTMILDWTESGDLFSGPITYALSLTAILVFYGFFAQMRAIKFHNKHNPEVPINLKKTDGYEKYFEKLDEGERFEEYRAAYKSFYSMHLLFPATLTLLFIISIFSSPQYLAIAAVSVLWFIMYMIYFREGAKVYQQ